MTQVSFAYENPLRAKWGEDFFKDLPQRPGVYFFLDADGQPLYIGKADNLKRRLMSYQAAKPGQAAEHILEMIELAHELRWEFHPSGEAALIREADLIRTIRPPFNLAGTDPIPYLYWAVRFSEEAVRGDNFLVDFRLSHREVKDGFDCFGCFRHRGKTKAAYSSALRLLFTSVCERDRFHLPAKICRSSPPYVYRAEIPGAWREPLLKYLRGERADLLHVITKRMLEKDNIPSYLYAPLQRDLTTLKEFFAIGPQETRRVAKAAGLKRVSVSQHRMNRFLARELQEEILALGTEP